LRAPFKLKSTLNYHLATIAQTLRHLKHISREATETLLLIKEALQSKPRIFYKKNNGRDHFSITTKNKNAKFLVVFPWIKSFGLRPELVLGRELDSTEYALSRPSLLKIIHHIDREIVKIKLSQKNIRRGFLDEDLQMIQDASMDNREISVKEIKRIFRDFPHFYFGDGIKPAD